MTKFLNFKVLVIIFATLLTISACSNKKDDKVVPQNKTPDNPDDDNKEDDEKEEDKDKYLVLTVEELLALGKKKDGQKVEVHGVQFKDLYLSKRIVGTQYLTDCNANEIMVWTDPSKDSPIKDQIVPTGLGSVKGQISFDNDQLRLVLEDISALTDKRCSVKYPTLTIDQLSTKHLNKSFVLEDVQFVPDDRNKKFNGTSQDSNGFRTLEDCIGNQISVYTSPESPISQKEIPYGKGKAIVKLAYISGKVHVVFDEVPSFDASPCPSYMIFNSVKEIRDKPFALHERKMILNNVQFVKEYVGQNIVGDLWVEDCEGYRIKVISKDPQLASHTVLNVQVTIRGEVNPYYNTEDIILDAVTNTTTNRCDIPIIEVNHIDDISMQMVNKLIKLKNVQFKDRYLGKRIYDDQYLIDCDGNELITYTNNSMIRGEDVPNGNGDIIGRVIRFEGAKKFEFIPWDVSGMTAPRCVIKYPEYTIAQITDALLGKTILLKNVQFVSTDLSNTFEGVRNLEDCDDQIVVYTRGTAFDDKEVPRGKGSVLVKVDKYRGNLQVKFDGEPKNMTGFRCR